MAMAGEKLGVSLGRVSDRCIYVTYLLFGRGPRI